MSGGGKAAGGADFSRRRRVSDTNSDARVAQNRFARTASVASEIVESTSLQPPLAYHEKRRSDMAPALGTVSPTSRVGTAGVSPTAFGVPAKTQDLVIPSVPRETGAAAGSARSGSARPKKKLGRWLESKVSQQQTQVQLQQQGQQEPLSPSQYKHEQQQKEQDTRSTMRAPAEVIELGSRQTRVSDAQERRVSDAASPGILKSPRSAAREQSGEASVGRIPKYILEPDAVAVEGSAQDSGATISTKESRRAKAELRRSRRAGAAAKKSTRSSSSRQPQALGSTAADRNWRFTNIGALAEALGYALPPGMYDEDGNYDAAVVVPFLISLATSMADRVAELELKFLRGMKEARDQEFAMRNEIESLQQQIQTFEGAEEQKHRNLSLTLLENYRTAGQLEARLDILLATQRAAAAQDHLRQLLWRLLDGFVAMIWFLFQYLFVIPYSWVKSLS
ncbi:hypothetical protein FVE85_4930 [Porphyridium purpureum]|uniref:Uncharacterized protein n=1 Tax=Porphyridium purpureum TaxID=35688 RepID=A0A5J4YSK1_PORPP|nr:hypothetical protein FVE85_4930 [Porphyridium purpureum]|eukprot:POR8782..scf236_6